MIFVPQDCLWVRAADGVCAPFDATRLSTSLRNAAAALGNTDWWLADSLAEAVQIYMADHAERQIVDATELATIIARVLSTLGFAEIAEAYTRRGERAEIQLDKLTPEGGAVSELSFFHQLDGALNDAAASATAVVQVSGLRSCVMRLRGAQRWGGSCRELADDIVEHVRERVMRLRPADAAELRVAVVD